MRTSVKLKNKATYFTIESIDISFCFTLVIYYITQIQAMQYSHRANMKSFSGENGAIVKVIEIANNKYIQRLQASFIERFKIDL